MKTYLYQVKESELHFPCVVVIPSGSSGFYNGKANFKFEFKYYSHRGVEPVIVEHKERAYDTLSAELAAYEAAEAQFNERTTFAGSIRM